MKKWQNLRKYFVIDSLGRELVMRLVSAWLLAAVFLTIGIKDFMNLDFCKQDFLVSFLVYGIGAFLALTAFRVAVPKCNEDILLLASTFIFALRVLIANTDVYFLLGVAIFVSMVYMYCYANIKQYTKGIAMTDKQMWCIIGVVAVIITVFVGRITIIRHLSCSSSNYDLGIFVQTFYNLKEHFTLDNTCERNRAISHLQVHTSLFYYVLAPLYFLFPKAQTLLLVQAVAVSTGVIPLTLLVKKRGISNKAAIGIAVVYLYSLGAWGGCFYDFHENVFLLPLLLWCFYCYEAKKTKWLFAAAFAVCTVKEDAPLYILIFACYILFSQGKKECKKAVGLIALSGVYVSCAFAYLTKHGLGLMSSRYSNLIIDDSLFSIVKVALTNPAYLMTQMFQVDKLPFMIALFLPIIAVLLTTKKY